MSKTILFCLCVLLATATLARAAVGVGRIHLDADFDGDLDGFEHQRLALTLRRLYPGHAAAHSRGGQQSPGGPLAMRKQLVAAPIHHSVAAVQNRTIDGEALQPKEPQVILIYLIGCLCAHFNAPVAD